ncbi:MAG: HAD-IIB family hydrolase [Gemmatimonadaceae bacterium]
MTITPIRLVCVDVDGTMVGHSGTVHPAVWEAAERARSSGLLITMNSGRPGFGVTRTLAERLAPGGWHCFQNGASVLNLATGDSLSSYLDPESVSMLVARARATGRILELYSDDDYVCESDAPIAVKHAGLLGVAFEPRPFETLRGRVVRAQWLTTHAEAGTVLAEPHPGIELSPSLAPLMPEARFINLTREGVDKATAVRLVSEAYGVPLAQVMYVGDGLNDTPALRIVGLPVAMANAEPEARAAARHHVGHVDEGGLAEALDLALAA